MSRDLERTIAFVDLAGFTALTEAHGDHAAADLIDRFTQLARDAVGQDAWVVKSIGDALMLASEGPNDGLSALGRILSACYGTEGFPEPRVGLHHGVVVERGEDYFGAAVNLAARVAAQASSGQVLGTEPIASAAEAISLTTVALGERSMRHIAQPVALWLIDLQLGEGEGAIDPVCRMRITRSRAAGQLDYDGHRYWFCSLDCAGQFATAPERFIEAVTED